MSDYVPEDVLTTILSYLPPKSLVRFTSVCKSWQSLITSSDFITTHLNRTKLSTTTTTNDGGNHLLLLRYYSVKAKKERYSLHFDNETFHTYQKLDFPFHDLEWYFRVVGSCNGLICLSDDFNGKRTTYRLWNPTVRKSLNLPFPRFTFETHGPYDDAIGFGFDSRNNDYKVVRWVALDAVDRKFARVEVFKLSSGSWETIAVNIKPSYHVGDNSSQVFLNGAVHWSGFKMGSGLYVIIAFDMSDEAFRVIKLPPSLRKHYFYRIPVAVCGEWLSFFHYHSSHPDSCSIWAMKEYGVVESWSKLYNFDLIGGLSQPLCFRINGEIIVAMENRELVSYDTHTQKIKYLGVRDSKKDQRPYDLNRFSFYVGAYAESLVLLGYRPWAEPVMQKRKRKRKDKRSKKNRDEAGAIEQL